MDIDDKVKELEYLITAYKLLDFLTELEPIAGKFKIKEIDCDIKVEFCVKQNGCKNCPLKDLLCVDSDDGIIMFKNIKRAIELLWQDIRKRTKKLAEM